MLTANGLHKLAEECGELVQIICKRLAYPDVSIHPDGNAIAAKMEQEIGDVIGAIRIVVELDHRLSWEAIAARATMKHELFRTWANEPSG